MNLKAGDTVTLEHKESGASIKDAVVKNAFSYKDLFVMFPGVGPLYLKADILPHGWTLVEHEPALEDGAYVKPGETFVYYLYTDGVWHRIRRGHAEHIGVQPDGRLVRLEAPETTRAKVIFEIVDWLKSGTSPVRGNDLLASRLLDKFLHEKKDA